MRRNGKEEENEEEQADHNDVNKVETKEKLRRQGRRMTLKIRMGKGWRLE